MKIFNLALTIIALIFLSNAIVTNVKAQSSRLFTVNDVGDSFDANIGDRLCADANGKCTLRAAIQESNACCSAVVNFNLPLPSVINLTLGELHITRWISIVGPGSKSLTIQRSAAPGTPNFRVFHLTTSISWKSLLRGFRIKNGNANVGGGIYLESEGTVLFLSDVAVSNNTAARGGGIFNEGELSLTRSLINSNSTGGATGAGGGLYNSGTQSLAYIVNSTVTENATATGGAIFNEGNLLLINDTVSHNTASASAGSVVNAAGATANVLNTIIGMDNSPTGSLSGAFNSLGSNLITDARGGSGFTNGVNGDQVSDNNAVNPLLAPLADNGGETETRALLAGSPAINKGNNCITNVTCPSPVPSQSGFKLTIDQRTSRRVSDAVIDVGAVESSAPVLTQNGVLGTYYINPRLGGCLMILTNAATNEKRYRTTNPYGNYEFNGLSANASTAYIVETQCKRTGNNSAWVLDFDSYPLSYPF